MNSYEQIYAVVRQIPRGKVASLWTGGPAWQAIRVGPEWSDMRCMSIPIRKVSPATGSSPGMDGLRLPLPLVEVICSAPCWKRMALLFCRMAGVDMERFVGAQKNKKSGCRNSTRFRFA